MSRVARRLVAYLIHRDLRRSFRRLCWAGPLPDLPADTPVVLYANHHHFYDGYLAWYVIDQMLGRPAATWMAEWDRFPFFAAVGALPFPPDAPERRAATVRRTARRFQQEPQTVLAYFPEGRLHRAEEGIDSFDTAFLERLDRLFSSCLWWPVAFHVTWWGEARPTAVLGGGDPHAAIDGEEPARLRAVWQAVQSAPPPATRVLLDGARSPDERWSLSWLRPLAERWL